MFGNSGHLMTVTSGSGWLTCRVQYLDDADPFLSTTFPEPSKPPSYTFNADLPLSEQVAGVHRLLKAPHKKIDHCSLQIFHTGAYLDLDLTINEQKEEFVTFFLDGKSNSIVIRTSLSIRVHSCIEKLYNSNGRELRRALFSLKQIFQDDKDLVPEFVLSDGLACLINIGAGADQNYQNYILRALGQIMLYIDGMHGVIEHKETVRWLYGLLGSRFRLVVKSALKLLLVFVEYTETNASLLLDAVRHVDGEQGRKWWTNIMKVLDEKDGIDSELLVYAMTLINKTLSNTPVQDTFYDITDSLEALGMEAISQRHLNKKGNDLDLVEQFKIYELALKTEDGDDDKQAVNSSVPGARIKGNRARAKLCAERNSVCQHSATSSQQPGQSLPEALTQPACTHVPLMNKNACTALTNDNHPAASKKCKFSNRNHRKELLKQHLGQPKKVSTCDAQALNDLPMSLTSPCTDPTTSPKPWVFKKPVSNGQTSIVAQYTSGIMVDTTHKENTRQNRDRRRAEFLDRQNEAQNGVEQQIPNGDMIHLSNGDVLSSSPSTPPMQKLSCKIFEIENQTKSGAIKKEASQLDKNFESTDKFLETWAKGDLMQSVVETEEDILRAEHVEASQIKTKMLKSSLPAFLATAPCDMMPIKQPQLLTVAAGGDVISNNQKLILEMLHANQVIACKQESDDRYVGSEVVLKENGVTSDLKSPTTKDSESEIPPISSAKVVVEKMLTGVPIMSLQSTPPPRQKVESAQNPDSPAIAPKKDSDLMWEKLLHQSFKHSLVVSDFDFTDLTEKDDIDVVARFKPPMPTSPPAPPIPGMIPSAPAPPPIAPPTLPTCSQMPSPNSQQNSKRPKTIRLFWKEVQKKNSCCRLPEPPSIWEGIDDVKINEDMLLRLFQLQTKDSAKKRQVDKRGKVAVLDVKRSNAINIGLTALPQARTIKLAILNMDEFALNKEQIEKIFAMLPTEEETERIQDVMQNNPDVPLDSAEQFLLTLSSISELQARLQLWSFKLDYEVQEKEIAESLIDLRDGMEQLQKNDTFKCILAVLKSVGNFLNNSQAKGFDVRYLAKVPEVKDTIHKQSLLQHVVQLVIEHFPNASDFYSDIGSVTRASKCDFTHLQETLVLLETRCKESWDHLKKITKHEMRTTLRNKTSDFLLGAAQRIITLGIIHKRVMNRFHEALVFFGMSPEEAVDTAPSSFCCIISEFALEYRTLKKRVVVQREKKKKRWERNKTRGKMITETLKFAQTEEQVKQKQMEMALSHMDSMTLETRRRQRIRSTRGREESMSSISNGHAINGESECPRHTQTSAGRPEPRKSVGEHSDENMMDELVKVATQNPPERQGHRRRRLRNSNRKSLRRTLRNGLTDEEKAFITAKF